jgi:hypothetical protein
MRLWLVTVGEPLPSDGPNERLLRTGIFSRFLAEQGHQVVWWTAEFDHVRKCHRPPTAPRDDDALRIVRLKS